MSLFLGGGRGVVFCQYVTLYICHNSPREGGIKENLASVAKYIKFLYTFPNTNRSLLPPTVQPPWSAVSSPHQNHPLIFLDLSPCLGRTVSKCSKNKWLGPALLDHSGIFENQENMTENGETYRQRTENQLQRTL